MMRAAEDDGPFWALFRAIAAGDAETADALIAARPALVQARASAGANRQTAQAYFLDDIETYVFQGDTPLHIAAAAYNDACAKKLLHRGAAIATCNRRGQQPLHYAVVGMPGSPRWDPGAQSSVIGTLLDAGADPNCVDRDGVTPLHRAVRTRCSAAVKALLEAGADAERPNNRGSTPMTLARQNSGRGGTGTPQAKAEQRFILAALGAPDAD